MAADAIRSRARPGDYVASCPDQLGPALSRLLPSDYRQVTYPRFAAPQRVDWVDYVERLDQHHPDQFAAELLRRAGSHRVFLVWDAGYRTHTDICPELVNALLRRRPGMTVISEAQGSKYFEKESVYDYAPNPSGAG